jgi:hypothetical protein
VSAEVPKLHRRLPLGEAACFGDRPPAEALVVLADPAGLLPLPYLAPVSGESAVDDRAMAFQAVHRFEYV